MMLITCQLTPYISSNLTSKRPSYFSYSVTGCSTVQHQLKSEPLDELFTEGVYMNTSRTVVTCGQPGA